MDGISPFHPFDHAVHRPIILHSSSFTYTTGSAVSPLLQAGALSAGAQLSMLLRLFVDYV